MDSLILIKFIPTFIKTFCCIAIVKVFNKKFNFCFLYILKCYICLYINAKLIFIEM